MARKPSAPSYAGMTLGPVSDSVAAPPPAAEPIKLAEPPARRGRTIKEASAHHMLYLHPAAAKALKRYALDQNTKVHTLLLEAVEDWFRRHGLREPIRAETGKSKAKSG